ncbi:DnaJ C-terminal domain-containing protein [uncultured Tateyamaria sp.]|uniref:DnaJ C-terminal domain-containing protein n=1 Tax=uncultured Tateyamaria sp. TaxID=455651 RepID=UPI0026120938|nr:DnaJ C-terminal domain-containing protein [uncultured Tateyamaria sp.]
MEFKDYYKALGVARSADASEIKKAFHKAVRKYHPDINPGAEAEARFKDVNEAYEVLKDPERRAAYDQLGHEPPRNRGAYRPPPDWDIGFSFSDVGPQDGATFSDFFETLFRHGGGSPGDMKTDRGGDSHGRIEITIEESYTGVARTLSLRSPVVEAGGSVTLQERTIAVNVPKGVVEGQHIRLAGQGMPGLRGAGDLFLEITFAAHPVYRVDGRNLHLDLPVTPWEAALGGHVTMPTPEGKVDLRIPQNSRAGQKLRLRGKGLPGQPKGGHLCDLENRQSKGRKGRGPRVF